MILGYTIEAIQYSTLMAVANDLRVSDYQLVCPPSIFMSAPVIYELAGLRRNTAAPLKSSGLLSLPSMFCFGHSVRRSG